MKTIIKYTIIIITINLSLISCKSKDKDNNESQAEKNNTKELAPNTVEITNEQGKTIGLELGVIEQRNLRSVIKASGHLEVPPQNKANVSTFMGGVVKSIHVREGEYVKKGQALVSLEHADFIKLQEEYITSKANFSFQEKEYKRQKELFEQNAGSGKIFQQSESNYISQKAKLNSLESQLKLLSINLDKLNQGEITPSIIVKAPIEGYVGHIEVNTGVYVEPSKTIVEIIDNSQIHVDLLVYEKDLFKVKLGQKVNFILSNQENKQVVGEIFGINKAFENETKALTVHAEIKNNDKLGLIPGMYVNALIDVGNQQVNAVPQDAVVKSNGKEYIFLTDKKAEKHADKAEEHISFKLTEVVSGLTDLGYTEIKPIHELPSDAHVVVKGAFFLLSKMKESEQGEEE